MLVYWRVTIIDHTYQPAPDLMILQVSSLGCGKNAPSKGTDAQLLCSTWNKINFVIQNEATFASYSECSNSQSQR